MIFNADKILKPKYDVIVIGAGPGGLTAASLLAKRGLDILVVEQQGLPGGACTSFRREGRVYDCGAALIFGLGKEGYNLISTLINLLEEDLTVIPREKFFRLDFTGKSINFWKDLNKFIPELEKSFPEEKGEIKKLYDYLVNNYNRDIAGKNLLSPPTEMSDPEKVSMLRNPLRVLRLQGLLKQSAEQFLGSHIKSKKLLNFYDKLCASYAYVNMKETPAIMALTMFTDNHVGGTHYVATSAQTYSNTLERSIERNGGTLLYKRKVEQILFEADRARGVILSDNTKIHADRIISDTTVWNLYNNLIPQDRVTQKQKNWVNSLIPTYPAMVLYAAVSKSVFPLDINLVEYYIKDPERIDMNDITLYIPSVDDESLGPSDEHIITIFSPSPNTKWPHPWEPEYRSFDYVKQKEGQAKLIISEIEGRIPGFTQAIKRLYIATPSTIERYTLKNGGCVGGPKQMIGQEISNRLHAVTEWAGLYACGDSTTMGMGMPAVTASGFGVANVILREMKRKEYSLKDVQKNYVNYVSSQPSLNIPDEIGEDPKNASLIARECQHCEDQPCRISCPLKVDIAGTIRRIEASNYVGAARLIREANPLPEICGHLCKNEELCEKNCVRREFAYKSVRIRDLHRWVVEYTGEEGWVKPTLTLNGKSVCVIGAGPSGLTCAHFLARLGYQVDLLDKRSELGGDLCDLVEKGILDEKVLERDLSGLMLDSISFRGNIQFPDLDLMELGKKYAAVYVSISNKDGFALEESPMNLPNVIHSNNIMDPQETEHLIPRAVLEGRKAAEIIHKITHVDCT